MIHIFFNYMNLHFKAHLNKIAEVLNRDKLRGHGGSSEDKITFAHALMR